MQRMIPVFFILFLLFSCKKSESDFVWEKSYGKGQALFIQASSDSGFIACGELNGNPYFVRLNKSRSLIVDFKADKPGLFSSAWFDSTGYIIGGNSEGKMLLMGYSPEGDVLWETLVDGGFKIDYTNLFYTGNGSFLAIGTASPDSSASGATGLLFVRFDKTGHITLQNKIAETTFVSANEAVVDNDGNIFLALTRKTNSANPKASVAKYNYSFQKLWETELYNNPEFGAGSLAIKSDGSGNLYIGGKTEAATKDGKLNNSFIASLTNSGSIRWKKYFEISNIGLSLIFDYSGNLMMMNKNCFIINIAQLSDGSDIGRLQMFSECVSANTDAYGSDLGINYDNNIYVAGSLGGNFFLALKSHL
ncbi:MAG TPA: hypothetical protein VIK07_02360 [Bacteroidales bacterium]